MFMSWQKRDTIWPVLCILAGLFGLILITPRPWQRKVPHHFVFPRGLVREGASYRVAKEDFSAPIVRGGVEGAEVHGEQPRPEGRPRENERKRAEAEPAPALERKEWPLCLASAPTEANPLRSHLLPIPAESQAQHSSVIEEGQSEGGSSQSEAVRRARGFLSVPLPEVFPGGSAQSEPTRCSEPAQPPASEAPSLLAEQPKLPKHPVERSGESEALAPPEQAPFSQAAQMSVLASGAEGETVRIATESADSSTESASGRELAIAGKEPALAETPSGAASEGEPESRPLARDRSGPAWMPEALITQLEAIAEDPQAGPWAKQVLLEVRALAPLLEHRPVEASMILHRLTQLGRESDALEPQITDRRTFRIFRQVRFGLYRRLDLWSHWLQEPREIKEAGDLLELSEADWRQLTEAVEELDRLTANSPEGRGWRRYLLLDRLRELIARRQELSAAERRGVARSILERFSRRGLAPEQQRFLNTGPAGTVQQHLRLWAAEPAPETLEVLANLEAYEATAQPSHAQRLANDCQRLLFSAHPVRRALGEKIRYHYQNPNLRIVVTEDLLNRLIPPRDPEYQWVSDTVLGVPVRGRSLVFTDVAVRTIPDPARIRLALEVTGRVSSLTTAFQGPAIFYNRSDAVYVARKPLEVGTFGIRLWPAEVEVRNSTRLRAVETDFDPIPLLGAIVHEVARSQHEARRWEADREVEAKLRARAKAQIDAEADARLTSVSRHLQEQILEPMAALGLGPEMVEAKTDSQRITMRLRIGAFDQLGANTPRPWAPSDSLASFQVHESAINNFLDRLDLAGRTLTLPELRQWVAERLRRPEFAQRHTEHDDVTLTFAEQDPVVVRFQNGRVSVQLTIVYLRKGKNEWYDFQVCAFYRPEIDGGEARLVRDGVVQLRGQLDMRSQIGLRGLFGKAFDKEKPLLVSPEHISPDPRMRELMITQFVIEDGWVGIAIGPKQRPVPPELVRLPKAPASLGPIY